MNKQITFLLAAIFFITALFYRDVYAATQTENTQIELYGNGQDEILARIQIRDGWHIYWQNPGEIGKPTTITATPPTADLQILNFSVPEIIKAHKIIDEYIYKKQAWYLLHLNPNQTATLTFTFIECSDVCKPETLTFSPQNITIVSAQQWQQLRQQAETTFPKIINKITPPENPQISFDNALQITHFIPATIDTVVPDSIQRQAHNILWQNQENTFLNQALVLTPDKAFLINITYRHALAQSLIFSAILAFIGGIILNAMPCVFPVLSLKIMALIKKGRNRGNLKNSILYSFGVLLSFWVLTTILVLLKHQGEAIGWGFQLQSPLFVGIMALVFLLLFLLMIDTIPFPQLISDKIHQLAGLNSFSTGFFSVLIASPCTGPFMGAAIGYALMQGSLETYVVFSALALGYALPYALIELYPDVLGKLLPKPGKWMQTIKYILSVPLLLTAIWLFSILMSQLKITATPEEDSLLWQPYDHRQIEELAAAGENIFIDFTADWCLTCKFNEKLLLNTERFKNFAAENNVHLFKADLTEDNPQLIKALEFYGRDSIPVYIYYSGGKYKVLPLFFSLKDMHSPRPTP